jgi:hypothetical protein
MALMGHALVVDCGPDLIYFSFRSRADSSGGFPRVQQNCSAPKPLRYSSWLCEKS